MNNLAVAYQAAGQLDKAVPLLERTLDKRKANLRPDHPDTLNSATWRFSSWSRATNTSPMPPLSCVRKIW